MQKDDKFLNNLNFRLIIYLPLISLFIFYVAIFSLGVKTNIELQIVIPLHQFITKTVGLILCIIDINFLKKQKAQTPEWGWIFIIPIYVFLRQRRNKLAIYYLIIYLILTIVSYLLYKPIMTSVLI